MMVDCTINCLVLETENTLFPYKKKTIFILSFSTTFRIMVLKVMLDMIVPVNKCQTRSI